MVFTSPHRDVALSTKPVHEIVLEAAAAQGNRPALVDALSGSTVTCSGLVASVQALAAGLHAEGLRNGDVLALHGPNTLAFPVVLLASPRIASAAVIEVCDENGDDVPKALVVRADETLTADEVSAHVAADVAPYTKVRRVEFVEAIPKAASGKILRRELREAEKAAAS